MNNNFQSSTISKNKTPIKPVINENIIGDLKSSSSNINLSNNSIKHYQLSADTAIELILNNKINKKNAFDVNNSFLEQLPNLLNGKEESWQRASASLDASAKIYGYRVDSVHSEIFKFLCGLNRSEFVEEKNEIDKNSKKKKTIIDDKNLEQTIEKDTSKLDLTSYDLEFSVDPLFKNMTAKFNETGVSKLLFKILPLNENLDILFESTDNQNFICKDKVRFQIKDEITDYVKMLDIGEIRKSSICDDLYIFKKKYNLQSSENDCYILNELLKDEGKIIEQEDLCEEAINLDYQHSNDEKTITDNFENKDNTNEKLNEENDLINEVVEDDLKNDENLEIKEIKRDFKGYLTNFGDGNINFFKDFSQSIVFQTNFIKNKINLCKGEESSDQKLLLKNDRLFDFNNIVKINKKDIFFEKRSTIVGATNNDFLKKKRKILPLFHIDSSIFNHYFTIDLARNERDRSLLKSKKKNYENLFNKINEYDDEDHQLEKDDEIDQIFRDEEKPKEINSGKLGKFKRTFNLQVLKNKMWEIFEQNQSEEEGKISDSNGLKEINFSKVIKDLNKIFGEDIKERVSPNTCFICLLHLANEKNLILEEIDDKNFKIKY